MGGELRRSWGPSANFPKPVKSLKPQLDMCPDQSQKTSTSSSDSGNVTDFLDRSFTVIFNNSSLSNRGSRESAVPSNSTCTVSMPGSVMSTSTSSVVCADLSLPAHSQVTSHHLDAWLTTLAGLTRKNLSNIAVPPFGTNVTVIWSIP